MSPKLDVKPNDHAGLNYCSCPATREYTDPGSKTRKIAHNIAKWIFNQSSDRPTKRYHPSGSSCTNPLGKKEKEDTFVPNIVFAGHYSDKKSPGYHIITRKQFHNLEIDELGSNCQININIGHQYAEPPLKQF